MGFHESVGACALGTSMRRAVFGGLSGAARRETASRGTAKSLLPTNRAGEQQRSFEHGTAGDRSQQPPSLCLSAEAPRRCGASVLQCVGYMVYSQCHAKMILLSSSTRR